MRLSRQINTRGTAHLLAIVAIALAADAAPASDCPPGMKALGRGSVTVGTRAQQVAPFCLDVTEVTVDAYARCAQIGVCAAGSLECGNAATFGKLDRGAWPVNCVTWYEADTFCRAHGKRLPTEAEWEWAARGQGRALAFPWGNAEPADRVCWDGEGNSAGKGERKEPCQVATNLRGDSPDGIHDLSGNVREWTATASQRFRVLRGGSWGDSLPSFLSSKFRGLNAPDERMELLGFRCAAEIGAVARVPVPPPPKVRKLEPGEALLVDPFGVGVN